jgi:hypothetical protein
MRGTFLRITSLARRGDAGDTFGVLCYDLVAAASGDLQKHKEAVMARNEQVNITPGAPVQLTNANATSIRVQCMGPLSVELQATNGATPPVSRSGGLILGPYQVLAADLTIAQLFPGVSGANRLWAFADVHVTLSVSHADA